MNSKKCNKSFFVCHIHIQYQVMVIKQIILHTKQLSVTLYIIETQVYLNILPQTLGGNMAKFYQTGGKRNKNS